MSILFGFLAGNSEKFIETSEEQEHFAINPPDVVLVDSFDEALEQAVLKIRKMLPLLKHSRFRARVVMDVSVSSIIHFLNLDCIHFTATCGRCCLGRNSSWSFWEAWSNTGINSLYQVY